MKIDVISADELDYEELAEFQRRCFANVAGGANLAAVQTPAYYTWKYRSPAGQAKIAQVRVDGRLVAMNAMFPLQLVQAGSHFRGWQSCDTATAPEGRGQGYFLKCLAALLEALPQGDSFFGFPNINSTPGFLKFGWAKLARLRLFAGVTVLPGARHALNEISAFDAGHAAIEEQLSRRTSVMVHRSAAYLNHRYLSESRRLYTCFATEGGYAVVRDVQIGERRLALIMDMQATAPADEGRLMGQIKTWARDSKCIGVIAITNAERRLSLVRHGLMPVPHRFSPRPLVLMAQPGRRDAGASWDCHIGDWDGF